MVVGKSTAFLLYYYPTEYMAALLTSVKSNLKKVNFYIKACKDMGIKILPPHINEGSESFVALPDRTIVYTLSAKHTNDDALTGIISKRAENHYSDFKDFIMKNIETINKTTIESLASAGALDGMGYTRSQMIAAVDDIAEAIRKFKTKNKANVSSWARYEKFIASPCYKCIYVNKRTREAYCADCANTYVPKTRKPLEFVQDIDIESLIPNIKEFHEDAILSLEKKYLGVYISGHPLKKYSYAIKQLGDFKSSNLEYDLDEETGRVILSNPIKNYQQVKFIGILNDVRVVTTKEKKEQMGFAEIEDLYGYCSIVMFPSVYAEVKNVLVEGGIYLIIGRIQVKDDEAPCIICESVALAEEKLIDRIIVNFDNSDEADRLLRVIANDEFVKGKNPLYLQYDNIRVLADKKYWINIEEIDRINEFNPVILKW